ncbi:hypothetical protein HYT56_03525 [Candidatus Woesearchaeota archaeon]|nr:hypothetical protein [Candidatus Woesearchaeota archaeon]
MTVGKCIKCYKVKELNKYFYHPTDKIKIEIMLCASCSDEILFKNLIK